MLEKWWSGCFGLVESAWAGTTNTSESGNRLPTREETHLLEPGGRRWVRGEYDGSNGSTGVAKKADCWILMLLKQLTRRVGVERAWGPGRCGGCSQFGRDSVSRLLVCFDRSIGVLEMSLTTWADAEGRDLKRTGRDVVCFGFEHQKLGLFALHVSRFWPRHAMQMTTGVSEAQITIPSLARLITAHNVFTTRHKTINVYALHLSRGYRVCYIK